MWIRYEYQKRAQMFCSTYFGNNLAGKLQERNSVWQARSKGSVHCFGPLHKPYWTLVTELTYWLNFRCLQTQNTIFTSTAFLSHFHVLVFGLVIGPCYPYEATGEGRSSTNEQNNPRIISSLISIWGT